MNKFDKLALHNCDAEPVHIPGRIQSFGSMFAFDVESGTIRYQSENLSSIGLFRDQSSSFLGRLFEEVVEDKNLIHAIRGALGLPTIGSQRERIGVFVFEDRPFEVAIHVSDEHAVVEFELKQHATNSQTPVAMVRSMMSAVRSGEGVLPLLESSVQVLRHLTGHDRVMAYRFLENDDGEVVAEAKGVGIEPFLGLRYPAWDIPVQVRQIMLRAPFRVIHDIHAEPSALIQSRDSPPLDLTLSHLRGVSPIHLEYLSNMGVRATMNTSIVVRGKLWGLFAFHHYRPRPLDPDQRTISELFGHLVSMMAQQEVEQTKFHRRQRAQSTIADIEVRGGNAGEILLLKHAELMEVVDADGVALVNEDCFAHFGDCPGEKVVRELCSNEQDEVIAIESLTSTKDWGQLGAGFELGKSAGVLLQRLGENSWLTFFRNEVVESVRWGGNKEKTVTLGPNGPRLSPRGSFAEYTENVAGRCNKWEPGDFAAVASIRNELWKSMQSSTAKESKQLLRRKGYQDLLIAELNHRVRNTLALVRSIARQTKSSSDSLEQYVEMLEERISALSSAHDLIGGSGLQWARIDDLLRAELKPFTLIGEKVTIEGEGAAVRADIAPIMSLLFHEITSNAVKHGALAGESGKLKVSWFEDAGGILIRWQETGGQGIKEPQRRGFGFALIERALPYECNGKSSIKFAEDGLCIEFWLPGEAIDRLAETQPRQAIKVKKEDSKGGWNLGGIKSVLVVEDNLVLAMEVERQLVSLGLDSVDTVPSIELAVEAIDRAKYDCAILDINLGAETSFEIASKLLEKGTLVVFASGYDSKYELPNALALVPRIVKPVNRVDVANAIVRARENQ